MIGPPVVPFREINQLAAGAGRSGVERQFAQLASHLAAMITGRNRGRGLTLCR
jgi:hypothetical protein